MLPKKERLSRVAFNRFFSVGKRQHTPSLQVVFAPNPGLHVSVVVSKKIAKLAVTRNRIRRRIYDIVRKFRTKKEVRGVFIFMVKSPVVKMKYDELKLEVLEALESILMKYN
jgi:ribonuclease P protein component